MATSANWSCSDWISGGTVIGGTDSSTVRIASACSRGQLGCCSAGLASASSRRSRRSPGSAGSLGRVSMGTSTVQFTAT